jgi:hypothetical protein
LRTLPQLFAVSIETFCGRHVLNAATAGSVFALSNKTFFIAYGKLKSPFSKKFFKPKPNDNRI